MATILGIDVTPTAVRGALVRNAFGKHEVLRYLEHPVTPLGDDGSPEAATRLALEQLMADAGPGVQTAAALDGLRASLRVLRIPEGAAKHADAIVPGELDALIPFDIDEAVIDHQPIRVSGGELSLLTAAVPEGRVEETLASLQAAGVDPYDLGVGGPCLDGLAAELGGQPDGEVWLLLNVGPTQTELCFMRDGICEWARTVDEGLDKLRERPEAMRRVLTQSLAKYRTEGGPAPRRLLVMGDAADDDPLVQWFGELLDLPAEPVGLPSPEGASAPPSPRFGRALALALRAVGKRRRINLRKGRFAAANPRGELSQYAGLAAVCALAIVVSYVFSAWAQLSALESQREALADRLEQVTERRFGEATRSARKARSMLEGGARNEDPLPTFDALKALAAISDAIAKDIQHDARKVEIQIDESGSLGSFELQGSLPDLAARDRVAAALEEHECFDELERGKTSTIPGKERKNYTLEGTIACPGSKPKKGKKGKKGKHKKRST